MSVLSTGSSYGLIGAGDGVQDKLSPNMAPWPKGGLKPEESEKNGRSRKVTLTSPLVLPS